METRKTEQEKIIKLPRLFNSGNMWTYGKTNKEERIADHVHYVGLTAFIKINKIFLKIEEEKTVEKAKERYYRFIKFLEKRKVLEINRNDGKNWLVSPGEEAKKGLKFYGENWLDSFLGKILYIDPREIFQETHERVLKAIKKAEDKGK